MNPRSVIFASIELGDIPASYATRQLADLGADVIKVEPPGGDPNRLLPPFAGNIEDPERSLTFINANTNKRSIVLDLERESDREIFRQTAGVGQSLRRGDAAWLFGKVRLHRRTF